MRALVSRPTSPFVSFAEVPVPEVRSDQALVAVGAFSLNRGEVKRLEGRPAGTVTGWDLAGVVERAAADGTGPAAGARVVGLSDPDVVGGGTGAWTQRAAVPTENLAVLPGGVSFAQAASLPVAGLTALGALEIGGFALGRRVLITGASGGVGRFAIQLAAAAGAHVSALARRTEGLAQLGADEVVTELATEADPELDYDIVLDGIGGGVLGAALQRVTPGGTVVSYAATVTDPVSYPTRAFFARAPGARLYGFYLFSELAHTRGGAADLRRLAVLVDAGRLDCPVDLVAPWDQCADAIGSLLDREIKGKAVLTVG
jgi:NADPH:quinone reductase-like Zn-dependent oxidoreductase